jgi:hypothetical protein
VISLRPTWTRRKHILDLVCRLVDIINNPKNLISLSSIDIGQQPVFKNICLDSPCEFKLLILINKVDNLSLRFADGTRSTSKGIVVLALLFSLGLASFNRQGENINGILKSINRILLIALGQRTGNPAVIEAVPI